MDETAHDDAQSEKVAASVRRALALVGPAESGIERISEEAEDSV